MGTKQEGYLDEVVAKPRQIVRALARRALVIDCGNGWFKLTPLGLAVKAELEKGG